MDKETLYKTFMRNYKHLKPEGCSTLTKSLTCNHIIPPLLVGRNLPVVRLDPDLKFGIVVLFHNTEVCARVLYVESSRDRTVVRVPHGEQFLVVLIVL